MKPSAYVNLKYKFSDTIFYFSLSNWRTLTLSPSFPPPPSLTLASISEFDGASGVGEIFSTESSDLNLEEFFNATGSAPAFSTTPVPASVTTPAAASPITAPISSSVQYSPSNGIMDISSYLNCSPGFKDDAPGPDSLPSDISDFLFNEVSQTSSISSRSEWSSGQSPTRSSTSSVSSSSSSPRKRSLKSPETISKKKRPSSDGEAASGNSKSNANKKENDSLIADSYSKIKLQEKDISEFWEIISKQDAYLACKMGIQYDSIKSNFSEFLVSNWMYKKIVGDEENASLKVSGLQAFRADRKNKDKRKEVIKFQNDIIHLQEAVLQNLKILSQELEIKIKSSNF